MSSRLKKFAESSFSDEFETEVVKYLLGLPDNVGKRALNKGLSKEELQDLNDIIANKRMLLQQAIQPIESIIHDFTVSLLRSIESVFISDNKTEVERLKTELAKAVKSITANGPEVPHSMEILQHHLNKIKDFSQITTPVEAVVFDYDGRTYKFAGNFAPMNQILGMFRYGRGSKKLTSENVNFDSEVLTEKDGKKVVLLPGGSNLLTLDRTVKVLGFRS